MSADWAVSIATASHKMQFLHTGATVGAVLDVFLSLLSAHSDHSHTKCALHTHRYAPVSMFDIWPHAMTTSAIILKGAVGDICHFLFISAESQMRI